MNTLGSTTHLQSLLDSFRDGHDSALEPLLHHSMNRCRALAHRMFRRHRDLHALDETDDVLQHAMVRLYRTIAKIRPPTVLAFFGLAARQIRWVLCDLARKHAPAKRVSHTEEEPEYKGGEPSGLMEWTEFHERIDALPDEEREVFDLLFYQDVSQPDAAALLGISVRSVKRRWQKARLLLRGAWPSLD
ncbi:MAG TPA: sigma-70 family RNA polymerase sigma factor [Gemmataceae bacterium]|jgi:RNA polymerase sigma-70 factor (ECF subfamily)